jgi:hypothetical protein
VDQRRNGIEKAEDKGSVVGRGGERVKRKWSRMSTDQKAPGRKDKKWTKNTYRNRKREV